MNIGSLIKSGADQAALDRGANVRIHCPHCSHTRKNKSEKSLSVKKTDGVLLWNCWHCGATGPTSSSPHKRSKPVAVMEPVVSEPLSGASLLALQERGISKETADWYGVRQSRHFFGKLGRETDALVYPFVSNGATLYAKFRSTEAKAFSSEGTASTLFGLDKADPDLGPLVIVEGENDALALKEAGVPNAVSVPAGAPQSLSIGNDKRFAFLDHDKDQLDKFNRVVLACDNDEKGAILYEELSRRIGRHKCWRVSFPENTKDANDILMLLGKDACKAFIDDAEPLPVAGLYDARQFFEELDDVYANGFGTGESTGYKSVDKILTIKTGQLSIVTGYPGSGKSELIDQFMLNLAVRKGWRFALCSFENSPVEHLSKMIQKRIGKPFFKGQNPRISPQELRDGRDWVNDRFKFIHQANGMRMGIEEILELLRIAVMRYGIRGAVIDPYNYISRDTTLRETDWISEMLTEIKVFAASYDVHVWFIAHPAKTMRNDGKLPVPTGYDISGGAHWWNKADVGLTVYRPDMQYSDVELHVWKMRHSWIGRVGQVDLGFNRVTGRFEERC